MPLITQIKLYGSWVIVLTAILIVLPATAQISFAQDSPAIVLAPSGEKIATLDVCEQRLLKVLDALDKAEKALSFSQAEIAARIRLDALKDELLKIKDVIIAAQDDLIKRLQNKKSSVWTKIKRILSIAEKAALLILGIQVGRGL